ncbi:MAG TPA: chloride channel protein [Mycobacteriales bacterium]|nr:chloride channel protein [Mycobacteriales bacterium]
MTSSKRLLLLSLVAAALGVAGGAAAWLLVHLIALVTNVALFHRVHDVWTMPSFRELPRTPTLVVVAAAGGLLVALLATWAPVIRGHGIPEAMEAVLTKRSRIAPRTAIAKPLSAAIAIGTGGPFGAEGPIIVTGGALGSLVGQALPVTANERKILLACGAAAGMSATFGAPLAAVVLAIELLIFEFSTRAFVPLVVAAGVAAGMHAALFGTGPLFAVPPHSYAGLAGLPLYVVLGLLCGLLAVVVSKGLFLVEEAFRRSPVPELWHPVIGGVGFALVGLVVPRALGVGYDAIGDVLGGRLAAGTLAALLLAKLVAWWVALGSGTSGGTLAPLLLIGGSFGALYGSAAGHLFPGAHLAAGAVAVVAMAAVFGSATRATFASIVFVFELTRDYEVILPLMIASVVADLVASRLMSESLLTEKLARRGLVVSGEYHVDVLRVRRVADVMTRDVVTVPATAGLVAARDTLLASGHSALPVVDEAGACVGVLSRADLLVQGDEPATVGSVVGGPPVCVGPRDLVVEALERMLEEGVDHLPVVEDGRLAGICTRTDVLRARAEQLDLERPDPVRSR